MDNHVRSLVFRLLVVSLVGIVAPLAGAEPPEVVGTVAVTGLEEPWSVAVQPTSFHWFISEAGKGRIVRYALDNKGVQPIIEGFAVREYGENPKRKVGPLGLAFLDLSTLVVGGGDLGPGSDLVRVFALPTKTSEDKEKPLPWKVTDVKTENMKPVGNLGPVALGDKSKSNEGNFFSVNASPNGIFALSQGSPEKGNILKSEVVNGKPGQLRPVFSTKTLPGDVAAVAMTLSPRGEIVVATASETDKPHSAKLVFFNRVGKKLLQVETGLSDVTAIAYGPRSKNLYAIDFSSREPAAGGLFRIDAAGPGEAKAVKIAALDRPTSMAFIPDGSAVVITILGKYPADSPEKPGQAIKFHGL